MEPLVVKVSEENEVTLLCTHREDWPPAHARLPSTPDQLRASGTIDDNKYQQLQTWKRVCGLMKMSDTKCPTCPLALHASETGQMVPFAPSGKPTTALPFFARAKKGLDTR